MQWEKILNWVIAIVFFALFTPSLMAFWREWNRAHSPFGYGYLVPPTVLFLLWCKRKRIKEQSIEPGSWPILIVILFSAFFLYLGILTNITLILSVAFFLLFMSIPYYLWGKKVYATIWGPLAFTATMIPWPDQITAIFLVPAQTFSAKAAMFTLQYVDPGISRNGMMIEMSNYQFEIAKACSGLTIIFPVIAIAILNTMMVQASLFRKAIVILSALPISLLANTIRIDLVGIIGNSGGEELANKLHDSSGLVGVIIAILFLSLVQWAAGCLTYYSDYMPSFGQDRSHDDDDKTQEPEVKA